MHIFNINLLREQWNCIMVINIGRFHLKTFNCMYKVSFTYNLNTLIVQDFIENI